MAKAKTGIVKKSFKACLEGDVYPQTFEVGDELEGEALEIGTALKSMGGKKSNKSAGGAPENKSTGAAEESKADAEAKAKADAEAKAKADAEAKAGSDADETAK